MISAVEEAISVRRDHSERETRTRSSRMRMPLTNKNL